MNEEKREGFDLLFDGSDLNFTDKFFHIRAICANGGQNQTKVLDFTR